MLCFKAATGNGFRVEGLGFEALDPAAHKDLPDLVHRVSLTKLMTDRPNVPDVATHHQHETVGGAGRTSRNPHRHIVSRDLDDELVPAQRRALPHAHDPHDARVVHDDRT